MTMGSTQVGSILGTAPYMSPEQARGKAIDKRTDVWAFGVVFYEMLTGKELFGGDTVTDVLAAVVRSEPDWNQVPARVRPLLRRCLEKDPKRRLRDIGDAMLLLEMTPEPSSGAPAGKRLWILSAVAALFFLAFAVLAIVHFREKRPAANALRYRLSLPDNVTFTQNGAFALSPDATKLAFAAYAADGVPRIWIRGLDSLEARPLEGSETDRNIYGLIWSPDGRYIAYPQMGKLKRIPVAGGPAQIICDVAGFAGGSWNRDDVILFAGGNNTAIMQVSAAGGAPSPVIAVPPGTTSAFPWFLPDGRHFLYLTSQGPGKRSVFVGDLARKPAEQSTNTLFNTDFSFAYVASWGQLVYLRDGTLLAQALDTSHMKLKGDPVPIAEQVATAAGAVAQFSIAPNGSLIYRTSTGGNLQLTWLNREGQTVGTPGEPGFYGVVKVAPDGTKCATYRPDPQGNLDIWVVDLVHGSSNRLTFNSASNTQPVWSPDSSQIAWQSNRGGHFGIYRKAANGSGTDELLYQFSEPRQLSLTDWSHDGRYLIYNYGGDVWALPLDSRQPGASSNHPTGSSGHIFRPTTAGSHTCRANPGGLRFMCRESICRADLRHPANGSSLAVPPEWPAGAPTPRNFCI